MGLVSDAWMLAAPAIFGSYFKLAETAEESDKELKWTKALKFDEN